MPGRRRCAIRGRFPETRSQSKADGSDRARPDAARSVPHQPHRAQRRSDGDPEDRTSGGRRPDAPRDTTADAGAVNRTRSAPRGWPDPDSSQSGACAASGDLYRGHRVAMMRGTARPRGRSAAPWAHWDVFRHASMSRRKPRRIEGCRWRARCGASSSTHPFLMEFHERGFQRRVTDGRWKEVR